MRPELTRASDLLRSNSPEAVAEAIALLQQTVFSFSMKMCGHREDAEDTMQDVLFSSLKHLAKIQDPNALAAWLYTVTRNRCFRMRRGHAEVEQRKLSLDDLIPNEAELRQLHPEGADGPESQVLHAEQHRLLHEAVLHIPTPLRTVLVLHDMEELTTEQVAGILGLQPGTVRVRLHRARLAVRKEMSQILSGIPRPQPAARKPSAERKKECLDLFRNLSEYLDARVDPRTCGQMQRHIAQCPACVAFLKDLRAAVDRCRSFDVACDPEVAARMRALMTQEYLRLIGQPTQPVTPARPRSY